MNVINGKCVTPHYIKYILNVVIATVVLVSLFSANAQADNLKLTFQIKSIGFDSNFNSYKLLVNVSTNVPGHIDYLEEYYTIDSNNNPKFVSSTRTEGGDSVRTGSTYNISIEALRPVPHGGKTYTLVKAVVLLDNRRVFEYWLTKNRDFNDNTGSGIDDSIISELQNIDKYEIRERTVINGTPVLFSFPSLGVISEINVTGTGTGEISLRVDLLKGRPDNVDKPAGIAYRYLNISAYSSIVGEIAPKYRVENSWMVNRSINETKIRLVSWDGVGKNWSEIPTKILDKDSAYTYFESASPRMSTFAIIGYPVKNSSKNSSKNLATATRTVAEPTPRAAINTGNVGFSLNKLILGMGIPAVVVILYMIFRHRKKKEK